LLYSIETYIYNTAWEHHESPHIGIDLVAAWQGYKM